jgi:CubicO group peptidase (beta-lactamase class C family)
MNNPVKKKRNLAPKIFFGFVILMISLMIAIWITGYTFVYKTLIYTYPDIDDINIFDTRTVNTENSVDWKTAPDYNKSKLPIDVLAKLEENQSTAYLIIKNDSIVHEEYWDRSKVNTLSNSFSVAKSIVSILVGIAADEGRLNIDDAVGKYLPEFSKGSNAKLHIRHLLQMSSGLDWDESYSSLFSKTTEAYYGSNLRSQVLKLKVIREPGTKFEYMSCNTVLLALIVSQVTGETISDYATEKLWKPIHATQPAYWSLDHNDGLEKSYCCFYSCARDFAKVGKLMLDSGNWEGKQIVSKSFVKEILTPNNILDDIGLKTNYYGMHWWMMTYENHPVFYARGILGQYIIMIPDEKLIIVRLGHKRGNKVGTHYDDMEFYIKGALEITK